MNQYETIDLDHDVMSLFICLSQLQSISSIEFRNEYKKSTFHVPSYNETNSQAKDAL